MNAEQITEDFTKSMEKNLQDIVFYNFFCGAFEMDIFRLTNKRMIWEYEIKVSKQDFHQDFKKKYGLDYKHTLLENGKLACNRFSFIVPEGLISEEDIPIYAGLIYYKNGRFKTIIQAPLLKKEKDCDSIDLMFKLLKKAALRDNLRKREISKIRRRERLMKKIW